MEQKKLGGWGAVVRTLELHKALSRGERGLDWGLHSLSGSCLKGGNRGEGGGDAVVFV